MSQKTLPFVDLKAQFAALETDVRARMDAVLAHGKFIMGPEVAELEARLADYAGAAHCVSCSSGTDALLMGLMALGVGPGDAVFTSPFTFIATAEVVSLLGATPVYVDIDPRTFNMDPDALEQAVEAVTGRDAAGYPVPDQAVGQELRPAAVIPVDLFGLPCDYAGIEAVCQAYGMAILEDAAQGFGGKYQGRKTCGLGHLAATSFFPAKPLGCYGDGGAVFTDDDTQADILRSLRVHGKGSHKYDNARVGLNARLDTLQAAILLAKLAVFDGELSRRRALAVRYTAAIEGMRGVTPPLVPEGMDSAWAQYSILLDGGVDRDAVKSALADAGVPTAVYYPCPLHLQPAYAYLGYAVGDLPASEEASRRILSLPAHPYLADEDADRVLAALEGALAG